MIVVNIDQRRSRRSGLEPTRHLLRRLEDHRIQYALPPEQTAGDEIQTMLFDGASLVALLLTVYEHGEWWVGVGIGSPAATAGSVRTSTGLPFFLARGALDRAKKKPWGVAADTGNDDLELERTLALWVSVLQERTEAGWEAVRYADAQERTEAIAARLNVTTQAVTKRLRTAKWRLDCEGRALVEAVAARAIRTAL